MPFLCPALAAAVCDVGIIYLSRHNDAASEELTSRHVYQHSYLFSLALIRLFLLLVPLPYHSYHGKALQCPIFYQLFYGGTIAIVFFHAFSLLLIDPSSLSSILSSTTDSSTNNQSSTTIHLLITRNLWWSLILTFISTLCHVTLFFHVRSTAPAESEFWNNSKKPTVLLYYVKEHEDTELEGLLSEQQTVTAKPTTKSNNHKLKVVNGNLNHKTKQVIVDGNSIGSCSQQTTTSNRMQEISNKFMIDMQAGIQKAKKEWTKRLEDYHFRSGGTTSSSVSRSNSNHDKLLLKQPLTPFRVVLELFAGEDVFGNGRIDTVYDQDHGAALMFFIPQLLSFLLHGAYESSSQLEEWILETCRKNIFFSHKCYWFIKAWALELAGDDGNAQSGVTRLSKSSSLASFEFTSGDDGGTDTALHQSKLLPEERAVIEDLMQKIMKCGEEPARLLNFGTRNESLSTDSSEILEVERGTTSPSALMCAAESGIIPIDPTSGMPSAKHFECLAASRRYGFLPLDNSLTNNIHRSLTNGRQQDSFFDSTPVFLGALITIADSLFKIPREHREDEFKRQLKLLEVEALPCNTIYIPLQSPYHRVWRINVDESIAISTKERVPCIICLEVVDYSPDDLPSTRNVRKLLEQRVMDIHKQTAMENDIVAEWRTGRRDPHRRETALEKLSHQMRYGMKKIPTKMRSSVKEQLEKLKNAKTDMEGLLSIRVPETFSDEFDEEVPGQTSGQLHTMEPMPSRDIERGDEDDGNTAGSSSAPPIPVRQPASPNLRSTSRGKMGQWSSPLPKTENRESTSSIVSIDDLVVPVLKHRSYQAVNSGRRLSSSSFGSTKVLEPTYTVDKDKIDAEDLEGTPSKPPTKPPPVVFKEDWKEKEDRIRQSSAFGNHPGWKLLPVLVKSNDDLRQEQLASQLIYRMALILARERVPVWLCPYEILALEANGGIIEAIPDTISIASLKKNDPEYIDLKSFFHSHFYDDDQLSDAKANFCESLAAYSIVCFLLQIKDRHNGNILLDNRGHLIHIDFGFFFLSSPGKNTGFESAPFKLTREFVNVLEGPDSHLFGVFRTLCYRTFIALRKHCLEIILLVEMLQLGNEDLKCFRGRPDDAIRELRQRFRLDLNDRACLEYVNALIDESLENWRTNWYDRYQRYCVGVL